MYVPAAVALAARLAVLVAASPASALTSGSRGSSSSSSSGRGVFGRQVANDTNTACAVAGQAARHKVGSMILPSIALACLASVPVDVENDMELMDYLLPMLETQSTLGYMKSPPAGYLFPGVDMSQGLKHMKNKLAMGAYKSQLDFAWDLNTLYNQAFDGHFEYKPALLGVFGFRASRTLTSISSDGIELPKVYDEEDLLKLVSGNESMAYAPSEVVRIDGIDVVEYLQTVAANGAMQDPDAQYNNLFGSTAVHARGGGVFARSGGYVQLPDFSVYEYANGTSISHPNFAAVNQDLSGIDTGSHLHLAYEIPPPPKSTEPLARINHAAPMPTDIQAAAATAAAASAGVRSEYGLLLVENDDSGEETTTSETTDTATATVTVAAYKKQQPSTTATQSTTPIVTETATTSTSRSTSTTSTRIPKPTVSGYPYPVVKHYNDYVAGYFLNSTNNTDVAVLSIFSFSPRHPKDRTTTEFREFRRVVRTFVRECKAAGRTKLIIDVSANGGGFLFQAYELYRNLFPRSYPFDGMRIRHTEAWNVIGTAFYGTLLERPVFNNMLDADLARFDNWTDLFDPGLETAQDRATNLLRYNFSAPDTVGENGFVVSGFGDPAKTNDTDAPTEPPFRAEDIVLVTDGFCASTCTVLARLLTHDQGVRSLALGGRPLKAPMQAIGGVKGAQVLKYSSLQNYLKSALTTTHGSSGNDSDSSVKIPPNLPNTVEEPPLLPGLASLSFNFRNAYRDADASVPQQFVYEAAHCRRFYTWEMTRDPAAVWEVAAEVAWRGGRCAEGSSTGAGGAMGAAAPGLERALVASSLPVYEGPGSRVYAERAANATLPGSSSTRRRRRRGGGERGEGEEGEEREDVGVVVDNPLSGRTATHAEWKRWAAERRERREAEMRRLSAHELELLHKSPSLTEKNGWWDHPGY